MFVEITDRERILALYEAGLLWDSCQCKREALPGEVATYVHRGVQCVVEWDGPMVSKWDCDTPITDVIEDSGWKFYILLED